MIKKEYDVWNKILPKRKKQTKDFVKKSGKTEFDILKFCHI